jgi:hypothetical protein
MKKQKLDKVKFNIPPSDTIILLLNASKIPEFSRCKKAAYKY